MLHFLKRIFNTHSSTEHLDDIDHNGEKKALLDAFLNSSEPVIIFDVGANKGDYVNMVLEMADQHQKKMEIHVFEPQKFNFELLKTKFKLLDNVFINNVALSNHIGEMP